MPNTRISDNLHMFLTCYEITSLHQSTRVKGFDEYLNGYSNGDQRGVRFFSKWVAVHRGRKEWLAMNHEMSFNVISDKYRAVTKTI